MTAEELLRLWDGRLYCKNCLLARSPTLHQYALQHSRLSHTDAISIVPEMFRFLQTWGLIAVVALLLSAAILPAIPHDAALLLAVMTPLYAGAHFVKHILAYPQTVCVDRGSVRITTPAISYTHRFSDCEWHPDDTFATRSRLFGPYCGKVPAIGVTVYERGYALHFQMRLNDFEQDVWKSFLELSATSKHHRQHAGLQEG